MTMRLIRVYQAGQPTPLQEIYNNGGGYQIFVKREDLGPINAYKWRGAYNAVYVHHEKTGCKGLLLFATSIRINA